jgi:hypothetical protein
MNHHREIKSCLLAGGLWLYLGIFAWGINLFLNLGDRVPKTGNWFWVSYRHLEPAGLLVWVTGLAAWFFWMKRCRRTPAPFLPPTQESLVWIASAAVLLVCWAGRHLVLHNYPLSMDEFSLLFQSLIFQSGSLTAALPENLHALGSRLCPVFIKLNPETGHWFFWYWPGGAALHAAVMSVFRADLLNPLAAGLCVIAMARAARACDPTPSAGLHAVLLLVAVPAFWLNGMTFYTTTLFLCLHLFWLVCFWKQSVRGDILAGLIGILAVNLHQPNIHLLFAWPFFLQLLIARNWLRLVRLGFFYGVAVLLVFAWIALRNTWLQTSQPVSPGGLVTRVLEFPSVIQILLQSSNLGLLLLWMSPVVAAGLLAAWFGGSWKQDRLFPLALGLVSTLLFYVFFPKDQGHGWGYRYAHPVLGNIILLALAGIRLWENRLRIPAGSSVWFAALFGFAVALPLRAWQAHDLVRPFAETDRTLRSIDADYVEIDAFAMWYGPDLIRNHPFLADRPLRLWPGKSRPPGTVVFSVGDLPPGSPLAGDPDAGPIPGSAPQP